ncbi:unnamed protein product [Clonostachys byssicola]|uniref:Uncharacterized protein n=1 Tax=Clonostachys byssicola TaxID=160290 RepID=A0A9N9U500_9HYPO|nr:unnamed protein product [Clonostachys byssicola]
MATLPVEEVVLTEEVLERFEEKFRSMKWDTFELPDGPLPTLERFARHGGPDLSNLRSIKSSKWLARSIKTGNDIRPRAWSSAGANLSDFVSSNIYLMLSRKFHQHAVTDAHHQRIEW